MFKTLSLQNNDTIISWGVSGVLLLLIIVNGVLLVPLLLTVYKPIPTTARQVIDENIVSEAVEILGSSH